MLGKQKRRKLYQYVVEELGMRITKGVYQPGETLPNEEMLCREFDVSRGVLREATKVLVEKGLIHLKPKIGTQIQPRRKWNLFDSDVLIWKLDGGDRVEFQKNVIEVRRIIEAEAARLAARRATTSEIDALKGIYTEMEAALKDETGYLHREFILLDLRFHTAILEASHNELIAQMGYTMRQALLAGRKGDRPDIEAQRESLPGHLKILNAIAAHEQEAACNAALAHIDKVWGDIVRRY